MLASDDPRRLNPGFTTTAFSGRQYARQSLKHGKTVEPCHPQITTNIQSLLKAIQQPTGPRQVIRVIEKVEVFGPSEHLICHLTAFGKAGVARIENLIRKGDTGFA